MSHRSSSNQEESHSYKNLTADGRIQCGERIGSGVYANVYRGQMWSSSGGGGGYRPVAIKKFLHGTSQPELCQKEINVLKRVNDIGCNNLVKYFTEVTADRQLFLVLEYCNLGDLYSQLQKGPFHFRVIQHFLKQICSALRVLHDNKILHRDIKPQNILLHSERPIQNWQQNWELLTVKLGDFGLSGILSEARMCFSICGSPVYMAPEIMLATDESEYEGYGPQADLFSLGVTLFQLATNDFPFPTRNSDTHKLAAFHRKYRITKTTGVNADLDDLLLGLLERDVRQRTSLREMEEHRFLKTVYPAAPASPKVASARRLVEEHEGEPDEQEEEETKCYGWSKNERKKHEMQRQLRQSASASPHMEPRSSCEVIKTGDPFEDLLETATTTTTSCRRMPSAPVPIPRGHSSRRRSTAVTTSSSRDSSLFGSIMGAASGLFGSMISKPKVRHEVGDSSRYAQLEVYESHEDEFVVITEREKPKPKPKPVYRYERIATTRCAEELHQPSRKSGLREEIKREDKEERAGSPETTTKKLKKLKSLEIVASEPMTITQLSETMFQTAADKFDFENEEFTVSQLSDDLFTSCSDSETASSVEEQKLQPKQRANSITSIDSGVGSVGSIENLSLIPFGGSSKVDQFVEQIWDNRSDMKRESFRSISDPNLANLLRVLNPVLEYEAGLVKSAPFEGDFTDGLEKILQSVEGYTLQSLSRSECDADVFRNAALLFGQSLQRAGNDRMQWIKLLQILEIFEKFSTHDVLRRGFRAMYEKMSEHRMPLMLN